MTSLLGAMRPIRPRGGSLWAALLLVLALGVMGWALVLAVAGGSGPPAGQPTVAAPPPPVAQPAPPETGLVAGEVAIRPVAGTGVDLTGYLGQTVQARAVVVESVAADEGFWVGTDELDRVWAQLVGDGESPYSVSPGDRVDFTARVVGHGPEYARQIGVDPAEGAAQLTGQGAHLEIVQQDLRPAG